jgi:hypothetical protein
MVLSFTPVSGQVLTDPFFGYSDYWLQPPEDETSFQLNLYHDDRIDQQDLLLSLEAQSVTRETILALPPGGPAPLQVEFHLADPLLEPHVTSWAWDFQNDGVVDSTEANPAFVYDTSGSYSVSLTIQTVSGPSAHYEKPNLVQVRDRLEVIPLVNTVVVDNEPNLSFISQTTGELVLDLVVGASNPISIGTVVIGSHDGSYARRVLGLDLTGSVLTLQVENLALTEIFNQADISGLSVVTQEDLLKSGFKVDKDGKTRLPIENFELHAGITISGYLEFEPALDWDCRINDGVSYFRCAFVGTLSMGYEANIDIEGGLHLDNPKERSLLVKPISHGSWFQVGWLPVYIYTEFDIKGGIDVGLEGKLHLHSGYSSSTTVKFGAEYDRSRTQKWKTIPEISLDTNRFGPDLYFELGGYAKVYLKPEGKVLIYGLAGPGASVEPYLKGKIFAAPNPMLELRTRQEIT